MLTEKEMTAPDAPTAIGAEQSNPEYNNIITRKQVHFTPSTEEGVANSGVKENQQR